MDFRRKRCVQRTEIARVGGCQTGPIVPTVDPPPLMKHMSLGTPRHRQKLSEEPHKSVGLSIPDALDQRLDGLVDIARRLGVDASRKDLVAALILNAPYEGEHLVHLLEKLRTADVGDAVLVGRELSGLDRQRVPGPRPRRSTP